MFNCERNRAESCVETCTLTVWDFVFKHKSRFRNPLFDCVHLPDDMSASHHTNVIKPEFNVRNIRLCKPILIRMPIYRNGTGNLDIEDIVRNLLFGATASELADVMNLAITPQGLLLKRRRSTGGETALFKSKKISIGKGWYMIKDDPVRGTCRWSSRISIISLFHVSISQITLECALVIITKTRTPTLEHRYMIKDDPVRGTHYVNTFLKKTQKEWPDDLGEPPQELFPPPPTNSGEVKLGSIAEEEEEEESKGTKRRPAPTRPSNVRPLNLSDVSPWTTRVPGAESMATSVLTLQRDSEGHLGIKFDDDLVIVGASPWAQRFGVRSGQRIVRVEGVRVRSYNDMIRHIPTDTPSFQITVESKTARGPLLVSSSNPHVKNKHLQQVENSKNDSMHESPSLGKQLGVRENIRGLNSVELASHLKSVGVSEDILRIMEQDNVTGDDFLLLDTPDLLSLGMSTETYTKCVMGIPLQQKKKVRKKKPPSPPKKRSPPKVSPPLPPPPTVKASPPKTPPTSPKRRLSDKIAKAASSSARRRSTLSPAVPKSSSSKRSVTTDISTKSSTFSMEPPGFGDSDEDE